MADILLAEDDADVRKWVAVALESEGHSVRVAPDGEAALEAFRAQRPDLLVLDVMMPRKDGFAVCAELRAQDAALPILMLTARDGEKDKLKGFGLGADDYVTKPFSLNELFARVAALVRRGSLVPPPAAVAAFAFGSRRIDGARRVVIAPNGEETQLAAREYSLLKLLSEHPNEVLARDFLLDRLWGVDFFGNTRTLDQHIALVRGKLGSDAACIETVRNVGYRFKK